MSPGLVGGACLFWCLRTAARRSPSRCPPNPKRALGKGKASRLDIHNIILPGIGLDYQPNRRESSRVRISAGKQECEYGRVVFTAKRLYNKAQGRASRILGNLHASG